MQHGRLMVCAPVSGGCGCASEFVVVVYEVGDLSEVREHE